jgi:ribosome-binding ATPase YchF (GTP1/OBG family)
MRHLERLEQKNKYLYESYYTCHSIRAAKAMSQCARFFYHRDYLVPEKSKNSCEDIEIARRELNMARYFFENMSLHKDMENIKGLDKACKQLRDAALIHFDTATSIRNVFNYMFNWSSSSNSKNIESKLDEVLKCIYENLKQGKVYLYGLVIVKNI